ncbi:unnamed protein product [Cylicocyclus nassatus]|uniref:Uncharacterized protein n=1 Tax=Cylicocyclus nassatus TaxID=53992 RepID=A0AA36DSN6_CYLNA|nr:unnamed protein product [Cylicocyclus nassatus]
MTCAIDFMNFNGRPSGEYATQADCNLQDHFLGMSFRKHLQIALLFQNRQYYSPIVR